MIKRQKLYLKLKILNHLNLLYFKTEYDTAPNVGIDNKRNFSWVDLLNFNSLAADIVVLDLLTPGIKKNLEKSDKNR